MRGTSLRIIIRPAVILAISMSTMLPNAWGAPDRNGDFSIRNPQSAIRNPLGIPTGLGPIQTALKEAFAANVSGEIEGHSPTGVQARYAIAVMDFQNTSGDPSLDYLQRSISEAVVTQVGKYGEIELVERTYLASILEEMKLSLSDIIAPEMAVKIGESTGATAIILGSFTVVGEQIRINTRVVEVSTGRIMTTEDVEGEKSLVLDLVNILSERLCSRLTDRPLGQKEAVRKSPRKAVQKSPKKAFVFSALAPGAGQIYGGKLIRGAVFLAVEAALWTGYVVLDKKGGDIEDDFMAYADQYWDVNEYLVWKAQYATAGKDTSIFTHGLPRDNAGEVSKTQQYYEMIGKYDQFRVGWEDYYYEETSVGYLDSVWVGGKRLDYMDQREDSNRYLKRAGYVTGAIFFNHIVSAIDAARQVSGSREEQARSERRVKVRMAVWEERGNPFPALVVSKRF